MNQFDYITLSGKATAGEAATAPHDYVRLQEMNLAISGTSAAKVHTHVAAQITDFAAAVAVELSQNLDDSLTVTIGGSGPFTANARLKPGGGLGSDAQGLKVESGVVSFVGHTHARGDITDFAAGVAVEVAALLQDSDTVEWDGTLEASVRLKASGGLLSDSNGVYAEFGTGTNQVARGDHTHGQLHNAATVGASGTLTLNFSAGQVLTAEALLGLGLKVESGIAADFGTGHFQVARGDHTHSEFSLSVVDTASLNLEWDSGNRILSGAPRLDPSPSAGRGRLGVSGNGLFVHLGTTSDVAASGSHGHNVATTSADGFMSAADKVKLDGLEEEDVVYDLPLQESGSGPKHIQIRDATTSLRGTLSAGDKTIIDRLAVVGAAISNALGVSGVPTQPGTGFGSPAEFNMFVSSVNGAITKLNLVLADLRSKGMILP